MESQTLPTENVSNFIVTSCGTPMIARIFIENGISQYEIIIPDEYNAIFSIENSKNETQQKLINTFCSVWENKFACIQKDYNNESILFKVPFIIKNRYNLVFDQDMGIKYNSKTKKYSLEILMIFQIIILIHL
jgi:hypothetical protein